MKFFKVATTVGALSLLAGCASSPDSLQATYVSPLEYKDYSCEQVASEMNHVSRKTTELYNRLDKKATNDTAQMAAGMLLFWPALFFLEGGDGPEAAEYSQMKGEYEALREVSVEKNCSIDTSKSLDETVENNLDEDDS